MTSGTESLSAPQIDQNGRLSASGDLSARVGNGAFSILLTAAARSNKTLLAW